MRRTDKSMRVCVCGGGDTATLNVNFIGFCIFCFLSDGDGNYDVNNAVISTPGPQNYRSQNASLQQSWEMNYQEAAIYLQVENPWIKFSKLNS